jgi:hypothetical protein
MRSCTVVAVAVVLLAACGKNNGTVAVPAPPGVAPAPGVSGPAWPLFGRDAQHSAESAIATQGLGRVVWSAPVDLAAALDANNSLLAHYGSPVVSSFNTVLLPVKTSANGGFRIEARAGGNGGLLWSLDSDYVPPPHDWMPSYNLSLTGTSRLYAPGSGGKLIVRDSVDSATGGTSSFVFYGAQTYAANKAALDGAVFIDTPVTVDGAGNAYFGVEVVGTNAAGLSTGGLARVDASGNGSFVEAPVATGDATMSKLAMNSAPALSRDGATVYAAFDGPAGGKGYLVALDSATLTVKARTVLLDPRSGSPAFIDDNGSASPTVGPDGDVFFGVVEALRGSHNGRGWLLHFDAALAQTLVPGSFGWDDTASVLPSSMLPSYAGSSSYLLMTKYNNYLGAGTGDGQNRVAVLDPKASQTDPISGLQVMREVATMLGPTFEAGASGPVKEWCINTAAVDPATQSILVNSEDGVLYRWSLSSNTFTERIRLTNGLGEAYTPTAVGADGAVYAVSSAVLFSIGK